MTIYEVHLGSWKKRYRSEDDLDGFLNYRELADELSVYLNNLGFTHVELIGIAEYPYDPSWGYQVTGYYAPTSRYGLPDDLRYFIDVMHAAGIGVIMDWVPAHFPKDAYGLEYFDGTTLYENSDPILREFSSWGTHAFDHGKPEVRSFLISNALYWIREFHFDALRVDAVAAMIHYNQDRIVWKPNKYGGVHNLESMDFLRQLNREVCARTAGYLIAEDATIEPRITEDVAKGGLGFTFKWNLGWMYDTLIYYGYDAEKAVCCHNELTHVADYAFLENYVLSLSHDEVSHFKGSLISKSLGSPDERRSKLKALYTFQYTFPGKKLLFMGQEFATDKEWNVLESLDWDEMQEAPHREVMQCLIQLIRIYKKYPCLYMDSKDPSTFEWINREDSERSVISYIRRRPGKYAGALLVVINFSACGYEDYSFGTPFKNKNKLIFSSSGNPSGNEGFASFDSATHIKAAKKECDGHPYMLSYNLRPFEAVIIEEDLQESQG
jgi:1,4-alpha-glucan branching enzyme